MLRPFHTIFIFVIGFVLLINPVFFQISTAKKPTILLVRQDVTTPDTIRAELLIPTFLGNAQRNFYGQNPPDSLTFYPTPELVFRKFIGPSVSTPLLFKNRLIAAGYNGLSLYSYDQTLMFALLDKINAPFEATPIVDDKKVFAASRDGYLYCLGEKGGNQGLK